MSLAAVGTGFASISSMQDLVLCATLSSDDSSALHLVKTKSQRPKYYTLKVLTKDDLIHTNKVPQVLREKAILAACRHPFIVKLFRTFNDPHFVYLLLEYLPGNSLAAFLRTNSALPNDVAMFYAAEVVQALSFLHEKRVAYRDLRPETILISRRGHAKLADFGHIREFGSAEERSSSICGFQHYKAPEVLKGSPHGLEVDLWALGVLVYEMLMGVPPFIDDDPQQLYVKILTSRVVLGRNVNEDAADLINGLLTARPDRRLKIIDVLDHPWFDGVDFEMVLRKEIDAPWVPKLTSRGDFSWYPTKPTPRWEVDEMMPPASALDSF